jgi:hypothetical protein
MNENKIKLIAIVLLCTTITSGALAINYRYNYSKMRDDYQATLKDLENFTINVNIKIDYGNGTIKWYNNTRVQIGATLLDVTDSVFDIEYQTSDYGSFVTSINEIDQDSTHYWIWNYYEDGWNMGPVGADQYILHEGQIIGWSYTSFQ